MKAESLRKITWNGMKGRKKDSRILSVIIALTLFFLVLASTLMSSIEESKQRQRETLYGAWQGAVLGVTKEEATLLPEQKDSGKHGMTADGVKSSGYVVNVGTDKNGNEVGAVYGDFFDLSGFELREGRLPEAADEILVEAATVGSLGKSVQVGDRITLEIAQDIPVPETEAKDYYAYVTMLQGTDGSSFLNALRRHYQLNAEEEKTLTDWLKAPNGTLIDTVEGGRIEALSENPDTILFIRDGSDTLEGQARNIASYMKSDNRIVESWALSEYREVERGGLYGGSTYTQNVTERIDGMDVIIHRYFYSDDPNAGKGEIYMEEGILEKQTVSERTEFTVVGIVGSYVGKWDMGERELPGILLSEAGGERLLHAVYSQQTADVSGFQPKADVFLNFSGGIPAQTAGFPVYRNRYTFPESGDTDDVMTGTLMAAIFLASVFAVFQVFLTQMKKRSRHISLLKCIAFSNRQILAMLLWEGVYVLLAALPFGLCFGIGGAWILTGSMKNMLGYEVVFAPDMGRLMIGILLGALALFGGMLLPMISALRAPLTGSLVKVGKRQRRIAKVSGKEPDIHKKRGFGFLTIRYYQFNRGKAFMNLLLITISAFMLLLTVFLCYQSFEPYRENLASGQPDYTLELPYTLGKSAQEKLLAPLQENEAIADIQIQKKGLDLVYAGENSEFGKSSLYAVRTDSPFYERYVSQITEGKIDKDAFERGEEVIVLVPLSRKDGFTYEKRYSSILLPDDRVKAGDTVHLSAISKRVTENGIESIDKHAHVTAAGIISWFDTDPIWPFTENKESFAVIGSENLIYDLYPYMRGGIGNATPEEVTQMIATYDLNHYGKTLYDIRLAETDTPELADRQLLLLAEKMCGTLRNYRDARESMYYRAMNRSMITALLGISVAVIVTLILYNMSVSRMEQERKRTGVLQSLGFGGKQFIRMYLGEGLLFGAGALVISDALFLLILLATTAEMGVQMRAAAAVRDFFLYRLQGFPWLLVIAIHVGILLVSACIACIPAKKVTGRAPIENIRELESE